MTVTSDAEFLVRVRAQVMMRDDSTGGWVPLGGGGLSWVAVKKRALEVIQQDQESRKSPQPPSSGQNKRELRAEQRSSQRELRADERSSQRELRGEERSSQRELRDDERSSNRGEERSSSGGEDKVECSCHYEYLIIGRRISDDHDVLSCTIKRDFEYNRVMPTFHHWRTGNKKFGLTFQTAADARTFDKGITAALHDLLNDAATDATPLRSHTDGDGDVFMMLDLPLEREISSDGTPANRSPHKSISPPVPASPSLRGLQVSPRGGGLVTSPPPPLPHQSPPSSHPSSPMVPARLTPTLSSPLHGAETLSLNQHTTQRLLTRSRTVCGSTGTRGRGSLRKTGLPLGDPPPPGDNIYEWLHASEKLPPLRTYNSESSAGDKYYGGDYGGLSLVGGGGGGADSVSDTYVKFDIADQDPQYHYPNLDSLANVLPSGDKNGRRGSLSSLKRQTNPALGIDETFSPQGKEKKGKKKPKKGKKGNGMRVRCAHCQDIYTESENKRGSCSYSPDAVRQGIECVSCLACAKCLLYHCHYEDENFSEEEICTCTDTDGHLTQRWIGLSLLAVLVPCLCLYPVLTTCYTCARACHVCGGKHVPV